jgi:hypothetical protein
MKKAILLCLFVTGCANQIPAVVRVEVPVSVPCVIKHVEKGGFAVDSLSTEADIWAQMAALRAERIQRKAYEAVLEAAIKACQ